MDDESWLIPDDWNDTHADLFENTFDGRSDAAFNDDYLLALFDTALLDMDVSPEDRAQALEELRDYVYEEYEFDFDDAFDWEAYRESYDSL